ELVRSIFLGAGLALVFGLASVFVFYGLLAFARWRWAITSGYPTWVIADVFCDTRRDAGDLINGTADFLLVPGPTRRALLRLRRMRLLVQIGAALLALIAITHWISAWLVTGGSTAVQPLARVWAVVIL